MIKTDMKKKHIIMLRIAFVFIIFLVSIRHLTEVYQPTLLDDEFSYWSIAAYFDGKNWSEVTSLCKYYSYGYSFILYLIMKIFTNTVYMYRAAIVLNGFFLIAGYFILENIFTYIFKDENRAALSSVAFLMTLIPCNVAFSTVNLTECLLYVLFLGIIRLSMDMGNNMKTWKWILLSVLMGYSYMVHQRMICVIIAVAAGMILMMFKKKVRVRDALMVCGILICILMVHHYIKADIKSELWLNGMYSADNDYGSIIENLIYVLSSPKNIAVFIIGIAGKLFYFSTATYIFGIAVMVILAVKVFGEIKEKDTESPVFTVIFVSFAMMIFISALFMCHIEKMAWLLYGRYAEIMYPLIFGMAVIYIYRMMRDNVRKVMLLMGGSSVFYILMGIVIRWYAARRGLKWINYISCSQIYKYTQGEHLTILKMMAVVIVTMIMALIVFGIRKYKGAALGVMMVFTFVLFYRTGEIPIRSINLDLQKSRNETSSVADFIKQSGKNAYYYVNEKEEDDTAQYREYIQYWLQDKKLYCVTDDDMDRTDEGALLIVSYEKKTQIVDENTNPVYANDLCRIYEIQ